MANPQNREDAFSLIEKKERETNHDYVTNNMAAHFQWIQEQINGYARTFPFMRGATTKDYFDYLGKLLEEEINEEERQLHEISQTTSLQFWKTAYDFDPLGNGTLASEADLTKLLSSERLPPIELGKVYGNTTLWLCPGPNSLPLSEIKIPYKDYARFPPAFTDSGAIIYPDSLPSIEHEKGGSMYQDVIDPQKDKPLRRFCPLGWIAQKRGEHSWDLTGHALVMDMDRGRDRHPWIVLASQWPSDDHPENLRYEAEGRPRRDDDPVYGIFDRDHTRTVVAKLIHIDEESYTDQKATPFIKQFGPKLSFNLWRKGGERKVKDSTQFRDYHPDLARIMGWFWDDEQEEEVCYAENGTELMRYQPTTGKYRYPQLDQVSVAGRNAMFGEVIQERMGGRDIRDDVPPQLQESTTAGY